MKYTKTVASTSLVAGALCAALLAGCGSTATQSVAQPPAAPTNTASTNAEVDYNTADAQDLELLSPASEFPNLSSFSATTLDGKTFTQDDLAKADATVINFWSPFCSYCIEEMPSIAAWEKTLPANVQVITVCVDYESDPASSEEIMRESGFEGATLVGGTGDYTNVVNAVEFLPTTIVVDSSGKVIGNALQGMAQNIPVTYGSMVNEALQAQGKSTLNA